MDRMYVYLTPFRPIPPYFPSIIQTKPTHPPLNPGADIRAGQPPSLLTHNEILRSISLYYLTDSFMPSVYTYAQEPQFPYKEGIYRRARTDAPMLVSYFKYVIGFWPEDVLRMMGNLVSYRSKFGMGFCIYLGFDFARVWGDEADDWVP